jgi:RNA-directed DNA polymerase
MGFFAWLFRWLGWSSDDGSRAGRYEPRGGSSEDSSGAGAASTVPDSAGRPSVTANSSSPESHRRPRLTRSRGSASRASRRLNRLPVSEVTGTSPYRFARFGSRTGSYLDLSRDGDDARLKQRGLPIVRTPEELAKWLGISLKNLAWLVHRFSAGRPATVEKAHYHFRWIKKRSGGSRLIESPKKTLKQAQVKILREILDRVPAHAAAHGFVTGRSIVTNAGPHVGQSVLLKFDLTDFYATVGFARVVAIFRTLGYSREAAIWLGLLTTSALPGNMPFDSVGPYELLPYLRRHLPQGAPTSPALANLSAYRLDLRLAGLSKSFGANYTRYADDLAISGPQELAGGLKVLIPLVQQIVRQERFRWNSKKRRVLRAHQRQTVAGVIVNARTNVSRADFDRLKAILTNCVRLGPSTQNRQSVDDFSSHLRGRIAHVLQLNRQRGEKLMALFQRIDWRR